MNLDELAKKQSGSIPGYELVDYYEAAFPVYRVIVIVAILTEQNLPVVQEYILKMLDCGLNNIGDIGGFLGLSNEIIEDSLVPLTQQELVLSYLEGNSLKFSITEKGKDVMESLKVKKPTITSLPIVFDALTGSLEPHKTGLAKAKEVKDLEIPIIKPYLNKPMLEDIEFNDVRKLIKRMQKENTDIAPPPGELLDIIEVEKAWLEYKRLKVFVFYSAKEDDVMVQVFERTQRAPEYETRLLRMEREGIRVLRTVKKQSVRNGLLVENLSFNNEDLKSNEESIQEAEERVKILTKNLAEAEEEKTDQTSIHTIKRQLEEARRQLEIFQKGDRVLSTYEHRPILEQALKNAQNRVLIISPWIERGGMDDDLLALIRAALTRKVEIHIGYGISDERSSNDTYPVKKLKEYLSKSFGKYLKLHKLGNTHEKVLVCDEKFAVVTSFNWLSFKGDPNRGFRRETGLYTQNPVTIKNIIEDTLKRFNEASC
ncbi:hypothetical protein SPSYN_01106 [Sporotomaculum syntrophicum]|uniref:Phospholipase D-like domain-containing protein n=1 Tax=Sporotomaculum syntrophicum TaxID=182264 RepID=A0A9D3AW50_9FIRM|nr:phospholipase D-like domain-containing protein [Sporotomaculum syntrophicum]KAF1084970.1 hypothetical protein SPSYN_01106 [Sporotomaculum syntrophicum]